MRAAVVHSFEEPLRVADVLLEPCYPEHVASRQPRRTGSGRARRTAGAVFAASYRPTAADLRNVVGDLIRRRPAGCTGRLDNTTQADG
jgi:hypothetical protein